MRALKLVVLVPFTAVLLAYGGVALLVIVEQVITWLR